MKHLSSVGDRPQNFPYPVGWMLLQVWLLRWDGRAVNMAAYGGGSRATLLGALPDRLLLLRGSPYGRAVIAARACSPLPALLQAWATLPASGLLPGVCKATSSAHGWYG
jgi:hypothetical protein